MTIFYIEIIFPMIMITVVILNIWNIFSNSFDLYAEYRCSVDFDGNILSGTIPNKQKKLIVAWIELRKEELITLWNMLQSGNGTFTIEPLK